MTVTVTVRNTAPALFAKLRAKAPQAIAWAVNRAATSARAAMVPPIAQDLSLKQGTVRDLIRIDQARPGAPNARLAASLKRIALIAFGAKGPVPSRGKGRGVTARLGGSQRYPHAFIATMRSGHTGVFERKAGAGRLPIVELKGPSLGRVFLKYVEVGRARAEEALAKNLQAVFKFALSQTA